MSAIVDLARHFGLIDAPHVKAWTDAMSLPELGELTAQWLTGAPIGHPSYGASAKIGPDPETAGIAYTLAHCNRSGYVTTGSQPALQYGEGEDDDLHQRAAVEGFADDRTFNLLNDMVCRYELLFRFDQVNPAWTRFSRSITRNMIPVSGWSPQYILTHFGAHLRRGDIAFNFSWCNDDMIDLLAASWQVTIVDPEWGRKDLLWDALGHTLSA